MTVILERSGGGNYPVGSRSGRRHVATLMKRMESTCQQSGVGGQSCGDTPALGQGARSDDGRGKALSIHISQFLSEPRKGEASRLPNLGVEVGEVSERGREVLVCKLPRWHGTAPPVSTRKPSTHLMRLRSSSSTTSFMGASL